MTSSSVCELARKFISTVSETSFDSEHQESLVRSDYPVANLDSIKTDYAVRRGIEEPRSADALHVDYDGTMAVIEFKAGKMSSRKQYEVLQKAYDSVVILLDATNHTMDSFRSKSSFILVYNFEKNFPTAEETRDSSFLSDPPSFTRINKVVHGFAGKPAIRFGLAKLGNHCFSRVFTYSVDEFRTEFLKKRASALA